MRLERLCGPEATIYSVIWKGSGETLFEQFIRACTGNFNAEMQEIMARLYQIGHTTGARETFFKHEGNREFVEKYGKYTYALYDKTNKNLRLYCIRFSDCVVVLGGGGHKAKSTRRWQDEPKLSEEVHTVMELAAVLLEQLRTGALHWSANGKELQGTFNNYNNEPKQ